jgi:hypothetical protein
MGICYDFLLLLGRNIIGKKKMGTKGKYLKLNRGKLI